jgi:hypothetical protein
LSHLSIERHIAKRVNLGGVIVKRQSDLDFSLEGNSADFAMELLVASGIPLREVFRLNREGTLPLDPDTYVCRSFVEQMYTLMQMAPLLENLARVRPSTQGCQILNRLHAYGRARDEGDGLEDDDQETEPSGAGSQSSPSKPHQAWSLGDQEKMKDHILKNQATLKTLRECFPGRSDYALRAKRAAIAQELSARPWSSAEDEILGQFVRAGQSQSLLAVLPGRDQSSIDQRLREFASRAGREG